MHNPQGKTKTAMLLELESIKGLLVEEDGIPILQEVIGEDIPVLDMIVQPEDLPQETIPLLVSVVLDEEIALANMAVESTATESIAIAGTAIETEQPALLQAQFAIQDHYLSEPESIDLSLSVELSPEPAALELEPETAIEQPAMEISSSAVQAEPAALTSPPETSTWNEPDLLPEEIPTLLASETAPDTFAPVAPAAGEIEREESQETGEAATAGAQAATVQHRAEHQQDFFQIIDEDQGAPALPSEPVFSPAQASRPTPAKPAGENPFLPEHIRARLQSNNLLQSAATGDIHSKRFKALSLGSIHSPAQTANTPSPIQQQLINEIMDKMLPEMARELRGRLQQMNKKMLEELLAEQK